MQKKAKREPLLKRVGRPQYKPTDHDRKVVRSMVRAGVTQAEIANVLNMSPVTLEKHFRRELDTASAEANQEVANALFLKATTGDDASSVTAAIFWLKCRAGWKDVSKHEVSGPNDGPIVLQNLAEFLSKGFSGDPDKGSGEGSSTPVE